MSIRDSLGRTFYNTVRELGRGGVGIVFEAQDLRIRRPVAKKVLRVGKNATPDQLRRFIREARLTGQLQHPNIVPIYELNADDQDEVFYTMRLVQGISLDDVLKGIRHDRAPTIEQFPLRALLTIFVKVCDAMAFAHSRGVVHRDLKPANVMIGEYGEVLVMDWGLAKNLHPEDELVKTLTPAPAMPAVTPADNATLVDAPPRPEPATDSLTLDGDILGTPNFMAPEQAEGRVEAIDTRTDIYALGAILYNLLTLQPPINETTVEKALRAIQAGEIRPPTAFNLSTRRQTGRAASENERTPLPPAEAQRTFPHCPGGRIPAALSAVCMKALATRPPDRYQGVKELQQEIEAYLSGFATRAEHAGVWKQVGLFIRRNRVVSLTAGIALAALLTVLSASAWVNYRARVRTEQAFNRYLTEQRQRQRDRRQSAPIFFDAARKALARAQIDQARAHADVAAEFDPEMTETWMLQAHIGIVRRDYASAISALRTLQELLPSEQRAQQLLPALENLAAGETPDRLSALFELLLRQGAFAAAAAMGQAPENRMRLYREQLEAAWPGQSGNLRANDAGGLQFTLTYTFPPSQPAGLEPLSGIPLTSLDLEGYPIKDLSPLQGMALTNLALPQCRVSDLSPLEGMPLRTLNVWKTPVQDLAPLRRAPLEHLTIAETSVSDLSPLRGLPLKFLDAYHTGVSNLNPLAGMPLQFLNVAATPVADLAPLRGRTIIRLDLFETRVTNLSALADMPLRWLNLGRTPVSNLAPLKGMPLEYLNLWQAPVTDLSPLSRSPIGFLNAAQTPVKDLSPLAGMPLTNVNLHATAIGEISALRGLKLTHLNLSSTALRDLAPLRGQPLTHLDLYETLVSDLTPLTGMPLRWLKLGYCTQLRDIVPLRGMPLIMLDLHSTDLVADFSVLKECRQLEELYLPRKAGHLDALRRHPALKWITADGAQFVGRPPPQTAGEFWKKYDASRPAAVP